MDCRKIKKWIPLYISQDLDPNHMKQVDTHLKRCNRCQDEVKAYQAIRAQSVTARTIDVDLYGEKHFFESIRNRLDAPPKARFNLTVLKPVFAGLIVIITALSVWLYQIHAASASLADFLIEEDYDGLYEAFRNPVQQRRLMTESVSTRLLVQTVEKCDSRVMQLGVRRVLADIAANGGAEHNKNVLTINQLKAMKFNDRVPSKITLNQLLEWTHSRNNL